MSCPYITTLDLTGKFFFFQGEVGIRDADVTGVQTCALPISRPLPPRDACRDARRARDRARARGARALAAAHGAREPRARRLPPSRARRRGAEPREGLRDVPAAARAESPGR